MSGSLSEYRPTVDEAYSVCNAFSSFLSTDEVYMVGSGARHALRDDRVGDVDLLVSFKDGGEKDRLERRIGGLFGFCKNGRPKLSGLFGQIQVDLSMVKADSLIPARWFRIAGRALGLAYRIIAASQGMKLTQNGLFCRESGKEIFVKTDDEFFALLGIQHPDTVQLMKSESYDVAKSAASLLRKE